MTRKFEQLKTASNNNSKHMQNYDDLQSQFSIMQQKMMELTQQNKELNDKNHNLMQQQNYSAMFLENQYLKQINDPNMQIKNLQKQLIHFNDPTASEVSKEYHDMQRQLDYLTSNNSNNNNAPIDDSASLVSKEEYAVKQQLKHLGYITQPHARSMTTFNGNQFNDKQTVKTSHDRSKSEPYFADSDTVFGDDGVLNNNNQSSDNANNKQTKLVINHGNNLRSASHTGQQQELEARLHNLQNYQERNQNQPDLPNNNNSVNMLLGVNNNNPNDDNNDATNLTGNNITDDALPQ